MDRQGLHELAIAARKSSPRAAGKRKHNGNGALISASLFAVPICDSQATPTTLETFWGFGHTAGRATGHPRSDLTIGKKSEREFCDEHGRQKPVENTADTRPRSKQMAKMNVGAVQLEYDTFGNKDDEAILLIMGLGGQMILWEPDFCNELASRGYHVIRFDNRDVGLSTWFDEAGVPDVAKVFLDGMAGLPVESAYSLDDMAEDCVGLLRGLGIESAHIAGGSMGGMVAQTVAINHPEMARSLTSIMSTTGRPGLPGPTPDAAAILATPPPDTREQFIEEAVRRDGVIGSPDFPASPEFLAERAARGYDRAFHPTGTARQLAAIAAHGDRTERLQKLTLPTVVIHGDKDPLIPIASGEATHAAIADSEFLTIEGMGHDLPRPCWPQIIDGICRAAAQAAG